MRLSLLAALAFSACLVARAEGQAASVPQTWPALFGGADARGVPEREGGLELTAQVFGGYDDDVLADPTSGAPRLVATSAGFSSGISGALSYSRPGLLYARPSAKGDFNAWANATIRHYPSLEDVTGTYFRAGFETSVPLNRRLTLHVSPRVDYTPRFSLRLLPDPLEVGPETGSTLVDALDDPISDADYAVVENNSFRYGATTGASVVVGTHSKLDLEYGYTKRESDLPSIEATIQGASARLEHQFARSAFLELGYGYTEADHLEGIDTRAHTIDVGIDYQKPLTQTRRTFLRVTTGSVVTDSVAGHRLQAVASASLVHYMGRTWTGIARYRRQLRYLDGFDRPVFGDAVTGGVTGLVTRRTELAARVSYLSGSVGVNPNAPRFDSYAISGRLRRAFTHRLAGYMEYILSHYAFEDGAARPPGLPPQFNRNGFRVGLSLWVPITE